MQVRRVWKHPLFWLAILVAASCSISAYSSFATYSNFAYVSSNSANNVGIVTQAVSSATFGQQRPFYESWDCMHVGRCSFLLIHTGFALYLEAPIYSVLPSAVTLLILQGIAVALAAIPLYWLAHRLTGSSGKALFAAGLFLVWAPGFSAFTLHLEAFLPLALIGLAALWQAGRYRWGLLVALVAFMTMEVAPVFVFLIGLFFLLEWYPVARKFLQTWWKIRTVPTSDSRRSAYEADLAKIRFSLLRSRKLQATLLLMGCAVVAVVVLYSFRNVWGYEVLGVSRPPIAAGTGGLFYDGVGAATGGVSNVLSAARLVPTSEYWLILFALVGFLPILAPRSLVISLPWVGYTFLTKNPLVFDTIGLGENVIIAGPLFIGVAYGLIRLPWGDLTGSNTQANSTRSGVVPSKPERRWKSRKFSRRVRIAVIPVLTAMVAGNVLLSPLNPVLPDLHVYPGDEFVAGYFNHTLSITPGLIPAEKLVENIPRHASVAAESRLFPLVANYPRAFVFLPGASTQPFVDPNATANLPFNVSSGPDFVLIEANDLQSLKAPFAQNLSDPSEYGLSGYVSSTAIGPLVLYERGFSGVASRFGPSLTELNHSFTPHSGLVHGGGGSVAFNKTAPGGIEIKSDKGANAANSVWASLDTFLPAGSYTTRLELAVTGPNGHMIRSEPVLRIWGGGFGAVVLNSTVVASSFSSGAWTTVSANFSASSPVPLFTIEGFLLLPGVSLAIASMSIAPAASP